MLENKNEYKYKQNNWGIQESERNLMEKLAKVNNRQFMEG